MTESWRDGEDGYGGGATEEWSCGGAGAGGHMDPGPFLNRPWTAHQQYVDAMAPKRQAEEVSQVYSVCVM